jgi:hypothetical protein
MANKFWADVHPVPYNITISMEAKCEHISDANQIEEQVLSRFAPEAYFDLKEFWFINKRRSIKMKLDSISEELTQDFGEEDKREITVSFEFTIEAWLYKTIKDTYIIDEIITQLGVNGDKNYWNEKMMGNYTGNFKERHDLDYQFGTKIGRVSALLPFEKQPAPKTTDYGIHYEYKYEELPDITNYPTGSKLLLTQDIYNDNTSAVWNGYNQVLTSLSSTAPVAWNDKTYDALHRDGAVLKYWQVTANSGDILNPTMSGDRIYQIWYDPNYVIKPGELNPDGTVKTPGEFGGTFIKEFENLKGFGDFSDNLFFGTKDAQIGSTVVKDAPWVSQVSTENNEII